MATALLVATSVGACSPSYNAAAPGTLPGGTAQLTINDGASRQSGTVTCLPLGWLTRITTGDTAEGVTAFVSNENAVGARSVNINDVGGFTGSYVEGLQGEAYVSMTGHTYTIRGTAEGFDTDKPSIRTTGRFTIKVAC
ncbi:lipoprotein LpqH [Mycobacterium sp. E2497]|uniref:lipoprotein LpqH n=1 Tax=Mycobacterium sp. E2497 TaxID=1834135 RepID=UPI000A94E954|nr:lipoprotein LpqH [Mycobacterium sp. E2497]